MATTNTGNDRETAGTKERVGFDLTPAMVAEVDRILNLTDLGSRPEVFRRAFTLLRIHVEAALRGREIYMVDPGKPNDRYIISLPFTVKSRTSGPEE
jgi:hypothetical protein